MYIGESIVSLLSIELTTEQKQALHELETFLQSRVEEAESGQVLNQPVESIFAQVKEELDR